ncbi:MAG: hypothetical protein KGJ60_06950 [Verrucomicrobiota bacterium]|nr:hypothetical protein [Verrucomicrobiota bacterium]
MAASCTPILRLFRRALFCALMGQILGSLVQAGASPTIRAGQSDAREFETSDLDHVKLNLLLIKVTAPDTVITQSCRVVIPPGTVIQDVRNRGVIVVGAPDIEIVFAKGSVLRGSPAGARPDEYRGYGIRVNGQTGVTIRGARISGFLVRSVGNQGRRPDAGRH